MTIGSEIVDLVELRDATPAAVFQVLQQRYRIGENFTLLGHNVLVFLSPPKAVLKEYYNMVLYNRSLVQQKDQTPQQQQQQQPQPRQEPAADMAVDTAPSPSAGSSLSTPSMSPDQEALDSKASTPSPQLTQPVARYGSLKIYDKRTLPNAAGSPPASPHATSATLRPLKRSNSQQNRAKRNRLSAAGMENGLAALNRWRSFVDLHDLQLFIDDPKAWRSCPHICGFVNMIYRRVVFEKRNHYICILGNTSSGKTSMSNLVIQSLPVISGNRGSIEELVEKGNKLMEVFGGAQVTEVQRSCRFGKYTIVRFDGAGKIREIRITTHLFEKLRIVNRPADESNFIVFYQLVLGAFESERRQLGLLPMEEYRCLRGRPATCQPGDLDQTRDWMAQLGFTLDEVDTIFEIVAAVLLITNISFTPLFDGVTISNMPVVHKVCELLGLATHDFVDALVNKEVVVHTGEGFRMRFNLQQANEARDGVAKNLYERLWFTVVQLVSRNLTRRISSSDHEEHKKDAPNLHIGILDTLGFTDVEENDFEQLCINYTNEKLYNFYVHTLLISPRDVLQSQHAALPLAHVEVNDDCIELFEKAPNGIFPVIEESCTLRGSEKQMFESLKLRCSPHPRFTPSRFNTELDKTFTVTHYAGKVEYRATDFIHKNKGVLPEHFVTCLLQSSSEFVRALFATDSNEIPQPEHWRKKPALDGRLKKRREQTAINEIRASINLITSAFESGDAYYICCLRPSNVETEFELNEKDVTEQVGTLRFVEIARSTRNDFPLHFQPEAFFNRYRILAKTASILHHEKEITGELCGRLLQLLEKVVSLADDATPWRLVNSVVCVKIPFYLKLEEIYQDRIEHSAVQIQSFMRGSQQRKKHVTFMKKVVTVQKKYRKVVAKKTFDARMSVFEEKLSVPQNEQQQAREAIQKRQDEMKQERDEMLASLKQIDTGETFVSPQKLCRQNVETKLLSFLTPVDVVKWRHLFIHSKKKGLDRKSFIEAFNWISKLNPISMNDYVPEDEDTLVQCITSVFDHDHDGVIRLQDFLVVCARMFVGTLEERLLQGFAFYDRAQYGDFSKDDLSETLRIVTSLYSEKNQKKSHKSVYVRVFFDNDEVAERGSHITLLVDSATTVSGLLRMVLKEKGYPHTAPNLENLSIYAVRMLQDTIIFQKRLEDTERPFDIKSKWVSSDVAEFFRFYLVHNPHRNASPMVAASPMAASPLVASPVLPSPTTFTGGMAGYFSNLLTSPPSPTSAAFAPAAAGTAPPTPTFKWQRRPSAGLIRLSLRSGMEVSSPPNTHLPFKTARTDMLGRGYVTVCMEQGAGPRAPHDRQVSLRPFLNHKFIVNTKATAEDVIELFLRGAELQQQTALDFFLYEIHTTSENVITCERPMAYSEIPLLVAANTPLTEATAKFLVVPRAFTEIDLSDYQLPPKNQSVDCYFEEPARQPRTNRPRGTVDAMKLYRLSLRPNATVEDLKEAFMRAAHAEGGIWDYMVHKLRLDGKTILFERVLLDEERPLLNEQVDANADLVSAIPKFLLTHKPSTDPLPSSQSGKPVPLNDPSFVEKFVETVFENREGYLDQAGFVEVGLKNEWVAEYFSLQAFVKKNKFMMAFSSL